MTTPAKLPPGVSTQTLTVPSTSRTAMYCVDARTALNTRRVVFQVSVPDCMTYVCGLCIFGPGALDQYDSPLICFDVSGVTQNVNIIVPDVPEIILGGGGNVCLPVSVVTLGPAGQTAPSCYDTNTLREALDLVESRASANPGVPSFEILVYPGVYETPPTAMTDGPDLSIIGQGCECDDVVFNFPARQVGDPLFMLFFTRTTVCIKNVKFQSLDSSGEKWAGMVESFGNGWVNDIKATFQNVCFEGTNNYDIAISKTFQLRLVSLTSAIVEDCKFDPGEGGGGFSETVKLGLSVTENVDVRVNNCIIGVFSDEAFPKFFRDAPMEAAVRGTTTSPLREVSMHMNNCALGRAGPECLILIQGTRATVEITNCLFKDSSVPLTAIHVVFDLVGVPWDPRSLMIDNCEFLNNVNDINIPSDTQGIQYSVTNCKFGDKYYPGPADRPTPKYATVSLQNENLVSENSLTVAAVHMGIGDSHKTNTVFIGSPSVVPTYVFLSNAFGGFSANLVDTITTSPYIDASAGEDVLVESGDTLWVGFSEPMIGLFYNVQDGGVHPVLTAAVKLVAGFFGSFPPTSRFVYDVGPSHISSTSFPANSNSRVYALPVGQNDPVFGITNGQSAYWVAMARFTSVVGGFKMNALRGVGCSYSFRNGRNSLIIGCGSPVVLFTVPTLDPVSFAPAIDPVATPVFFGKQLQFSSPLKLDGSATGVQGGTVSFGIPNSVDPSQPIMVVVAVGVTGIGNTTAAIRLQIGRLRGIQTNNAISLSALVADPPLFYDSGYTVISPAPVNTTEKVMFTIPGGTFLSDSGSMSAITTITLLVSRDVTEDEDILSDIHILNTTICYSKFQ